MRVSQRFVSGVLSLLAATCLPARAADVFQQVPRDALGLVVVRNLSQTDAKATRLLSAVGLRLPGPLALLQGIAGIGTGLDRERDLLLVLLPPENNSRQFHLAVWLPVDDFDALVRSLEGDPTRRIAAVTIAGEDVLVARHGDWAVVMDPDQRDRLEQLHDAAPSPPRQVAEWSAWIAGNEASIVVLPAGMQIACDWAAAQKLFERRPSAPMEAEVDDEVLLDNAPRTTPTGSAWLAARESLRAVLAVAPALGRWLAEAEGAACGLRLDDAGNAVVGVRLALADGARQPARPSMTPPRLYDGGEFVLTGSGQLSQWWAVPLVAPYVRQMVHDLAAQYEIKLNEGDVAQFRREIEQAVAAADAFAVLARPGEGLEGAFTNNFLVVRTASADDFLERVAAAMRQWNAMLERASGSIRLVFDTKHVEIAGRPGTEHSIDMAAAVDAPDLPEIRHSMEQLFGPGGKLRFQFVRVDEHTVFLAVATKKQTAAAIEIVTRGAVPPGEPPELREATQLLADGGDWRFYFSPHGYNRWLTRQMDAMLGQVIGGPVVRQLPASPPISVTGGVDGDILWLEVAAPAQTLRSVGRYARQ